MSRIRNKKQLAENGKTALTKKARALALDSLEHALKAAEPKKLMHLKLSLEGSRLRSDGCQYDLNTFRHVYVVGGGKAGKAMSEALEEVIGSRITAGVVNVPYGIKQKTRIIELNEASHPIPDEAGAEGVKRMIALAEQADLDDLVICLLSGGGSSLMPLPREGVTLKYKQEITKALLKSGASIQEINVVRKHLSAVKGGWLAQKAYPATVLTLILSDVVGDSLSAIASGPTVPDPSTFADAKRILGKYGLWVGLSDSVRRFFSEGIANKVDETPKPGDRAFERVCNVIVGNNRVACDAAIEFLRSKGLNTFLVKEPLTGEARDVGEKLALLARRIAASRKPVAKPAGIVAGGETTVTVVGKGKGGRNQELALATALRVENVDGCVLALIGTDGIDGSTDAAGAIVDGFTLAEAKQLKLNPQVFLADNDSYGFFSRLDDLIVTGATGTNVTDISVIVLL